MATKFVPASEVRAWFNEKFPRNDAGEFTGKAPEFPTPGTRGKLHPDTVKAFHKANKSKRYEQGGEAQKPTVTVSVKSLDKNGRATTKPVTVTREYARSLVNPGGAKRGRIPKATLSLALEAVALAE